MLSPNLMDLQAKANSLRPFIALLPLLALTGPVGHDAAASPAAGAGAQTHPDRPTIAALALPPPGLPPGLPAQARFPGANASGRESLIPGRQTANAGRPRGFYFTRAAYSGYGRGFGRGRPPWATDYPKADLQFLTVLQRLLPTLDVYGAEHPIRFSDPELRKYPFVYAVEVSNMDLSEEEVHGLRDYLQAGGFLFVDDFWGTREWEAFAYQLRRVLPGREIIDLPLDHPIFNTYYQIDKVVQVPVVRSACNGGPTYEQDGYVPAVRAILDDAGRIMVLISWNSDLVDAWEWAEQSCYPLEYSTYAFQLAVNTIVYAMSR